MQKNGLKTEITFFDRIDHVIWRVFLIWTCIGLFVMPWNPGLREISQLTANPAQQSFLIEFLRNADAIWIFLAAMTVYFWMIRMEGLGNARIQAAIIMFGSTVVEWVGHETGLPFGPYLYTANFGPRLAGVLPLAIPLAWLVIVICAVAIMRRTPLAGNRLAVATGAAFIATLTDLNLEPVAWKVRMYWLWYPGQDNAPAWPPIQNYVSWFVLSFVFVLVLPGIRSGLGGKSWHRPAMVIALINLLLIVTNAVHFLF